MKHKELVEKLPVKAKIALITDENAQGSEAVKALNLPFTKVVSLEERNNLAAIPQRLIPYEGLIDSWNTDYAEESSKLLASRAKADGARAQIVASAKVKSNPYSNGLSEDGCLLGAFVTACAKGVYSVGAAPLLTGFTLCKQDAEFADISITSRAVSEYFLSAFNMAVSSRYVAGLVWDADSVYDNYNENTLPAVIKNMSAKIPYSFCVTATPNQTVKQLAMGNIVLNGSTLSAENAYNNYLQYEQSVAKGDLSFEDLKAENTSDPILSPDQIDEATDEVIDFALYCDEKSKNGANIEPDGELLLKMAEESIVLLKNDKDLLPVNFGSKLAVVGNDGAIDGFYEKLSICDGDIPRAVGYKSDCEDIGCLTQEQIDDICGRDVIIFIIDNLRAHGSPSKLPANRLAVLDELSKTGKKIIAVVVGANALDMSFDKVCSSVILMRGVGGCSAQALVNILMGEANPSGRLATTYYDDTDKLMNQIKRDRDLRLNKVGMFFGYRRYDSSDIKVKYPFGHGLSYSKFVYSGLQCSPSEVTCQVKNVGKTMAYETVQVYVQKLSSSVVRPKKQLVAFKKVAIEPNSTVSVTIPLPDELMPIYIKAKNEYVQEGGAYKVFVAHSVSDVRLEGRINKEGKKIVPTKEKLKDYLQSESNIVSDGFTFEYEAFKMKKRKKLSICSIILIILALAIDVAAALLALLYVPKYMYENTIFLIISGSALGVINLILITFIIVLAVNNHKIKKIKALISQKKAQTFADAPFIPDSQLDSAFADYDAKTAEEGEAEAEEEAAAAFKEFDKSIVMNSVCTSLHTRLSEGGLGVNMDSVRSLVSSIGSSRLLIVKNSDVALAKRLIEAVAGYFGSKPYGVTAISDEADANGEAVKKTESALSEAETDLDTLHFMVYENVTASQAEFIKSYLPYVLNPEGGRKLVLHSASGDKVFNIPANMWIAVVLSPDQKSDALPKDLLACASVWEEELTLKEASQKLTPVNKIGYAQFVEMANVAQDKFAVSEECWKKVDRLEEMVSGLGFHIYNKYWHSLELYAGVFLSCTGEENTMLDYLVAQKLLPSVLLYLKLGGDANVNQTLEALESFFGEENVKLMKKVVKNSSIASL